MPGSLSQWIDPALRPEWSCGLQAIPICRPITHSRPAKGLLIVHNEFSKGISFFYSPDPWPEDKTNAGYFLFMEQRSNFELGSIKEDRESGNRITDFFVVDDNLDDVACAN
jgi:hypothetical protein